MNNRNKRLIGFSTGSLWHIYPRISKTIIRECKDMGCNAIEIHCLVEDLHLMDKLKPDDLKGFDFVAFHLPCGIEDLDVLNVIQEVHDRLQFDIITIHPSEIGDWNNLKSYSMPFSVENMDEGKKIGKTLESIRELVSYNDYKVTLDINHCYVNDPTLKLAEDIWNEFEDRISHFHLSGYIKIHDPLITTQQTSFIDFIKNKDKPIIIESVCKDLDQAKKEFNFVTNCLK